MWQQDTAPSGYSWQDALPYCENLTLAGYNDWRLPDINELQSLVDYSRYLPSIDPVFSNTVSSYHWSSTSYAYGPSYACVVSFYEGATGGYGKSNSFYVRAVRGGQCGSSDTSTTTTAAGSTTTTDESSTTTTSICAMQISYGENSEEVELLRYIRDNVLSKTPEGQEIIKLYYQWSPAIVKAMEEDEVFKEDVKEMIDGVLGLVGGE